MRRLLRGLWLLINTAYRLVVLLVLAAVGLAIWAAVRDAAPPRVPDGVALVIAPSGVVVDHLDADPFERFVQDMAGEPPSQTLLRDLTDALQAAAEDRRIRSVVLDLRDLWAIGQAQARELAAALDAVRRAGKPVHAHELFYGQTAYLIAARADTVSLDPLGGVWIEGFSVWRNYYRDALDKLGIRVHVFRAGRYKSAVEPFERMDMSEPAREANAALLEDLWRLYLRDIEIARSLPPQALRAYLDELISGEEFDGDGAALAQRHQLVTHVESREAFRARMAEQVGRDEEHGSFRQVHHAQYLKAARAEGRVPGARAEDTIALVVVQGEIVDGGADQGMVDGEAVAEQLLRAGRDDSVAAVVLRIDSPGGSMFGAERIRRAVEQLRETGMPVVVSMGNLAASGGYWAALDADRIFAHETTLTGSIGVFGLIPTAEEGLARLGITTDGLGTTPLAGAIRFDRPLAEPAARLIAREIAHAYEQFVDRVARSRGMAPDAVRAVAEGRVWSGTDALDIGLVDEIGGLDAAVAAAAKLAGIERYRLVEFRDEQRLPFPLPGWRGLSIALPGGSVRIPPEAVPVALRPLLGELSWLRDPRGVYAHCLCAAPSPAR